MRTATDITTSFLGRLWLKQKLALLVAAMAIPAVLLGLFYFGQATSATHQAREELNGTRYLKVLGHLGTELMTYRDRIYTFLTGEQAQRAALISDAQEIDRQIGAADAVNAQLGGRYGVSQAWQGVQSEWSSLRAKTQGSADEADTASAALALHFARLQHDIASRSLTSADPEADTRSLTRIAADYAPGLLLYSGQIRRHAVRAASKGYLGGDDRMAIRLSRDRQLAALATLRGSLEQLPVEVRTALQPAVESASAAADAYYAFIQSKLLTASNIDTAPGQIFEAGVTASLACGNISLVSYDLLTDRVAKRLSHLIAREAITAAITLSALLLALVLAWLINRSLSHRMRLAISVFGRIASGEYDSKLHVRGRDEVGQVLRALEEMQRKLRTQLEIERAAAAENSRIRQALDKTSTSVLLADASHRIIYLNETAQGTFSRGETELRSELPAFNAQQLRGSELPTLSADSSAERRLLDGLNGADARQRTLGALTFRTVSSPVMGKHGERIGTVVEWTDRTQEVAIENQMQNMLTAVVDGDLSRRIALDGKTGFFEAASRSVNQLADNMAEIVSLVKEAAGEVYRGSKEISSGNTNLQMRTEEQSASLEETASSMEEMTMTVKRNADNAGQAKQLAVAAREQAEQGGAVVGKAVHAMDEINDAARKIADIIGVIDDIAFQTNLLALNAAVEAARAGEQGRGFAVVATEVRTLAGRSATAAKEIKGLIQDSVRKVGDGSHLVTQSGQTLEQIVASVKKVSDIVAEIAAASLEQSAGIAQVNRAVLQMDDLTQQNAALVEQATTASQAMAREAHSLHEMMGGYRLGEVYQSRRSGAPKADSDSTRGATDSSGAAQGTALRSSVPKRPLVPSVRAARAQRAAARNDKAEWQEF